MNRKALGALYTLQIIESTQGYPRRASGKTEHLRAFISIKRLERTPPPDNDRIRAGIPVIFRCRAPLINVDIWSTGYEQFEFLLIELIRVALIIEQLTGGNYQRTIAIRSFGIIS